MFAVANRAPVVLGFDPFGAQPPMFAFVAPLAAGLLADALGFRAVFGVATVGSLVGLAMLATLVRDPRHVAGPAVESRA